MTLNSNLIITFLKDKKVKSKLFIQILHLHSGEIEWKN